MCPQQLAAKQAAAAATQTIAAAQNAAASNKNTVSHQQLVHSCKVTGFVSRMWHKSLLDFAFEKVETNDIL